VRDGVLVLEIEDGLLKPLALGLLILKRLLRTGGFRLLLLLVCLFLLSREDR